MFQYIFSLLLAVILSLVFFFDLGLTNDGIGNLFVAGILGCLVLFLLFKFGVHYKIQGLNRFASAFYFSVFEYKKAQVKPSEMNYMDSVREQAEVALAANFDPTLTTGDLKIPTTLYSGKDPFLKTLRAKIEQKLKEQAEREAENLKKEHKLLAKVEQERVAALAKKEQAESEAEKLKKEKELALAKAEQERVAALAKQEVELDKQKQLEVAKTEQKLKEEAEGEAEKVKKEKELALEKAALEHKDDLAAQKSELEKEKAKALSEKEQVFTKKLALQKRLLAEAAEEL